MAKLIDANEPLLQLKADPSALAPERLLVFELTGGVMKFHDAVRLIEGLEFLGAEDIEEDEFDKNPTLYLMVPSEGAFKNIVNLWRGWQNNGTVPSGYSSWKSLLSQLRDIRPWGPQDRVSQNDLDIFGGALALGNPFTRVEVELVFRKQGEQTEQEARAQITNDGGTVISRSRIVGAGYHALLVDIPAAALQRVVERSAGGLAGSDAVLQIRPQSILQQMPSEEVVGEAAGNDTVLNSDPIVAIFDAVPLSGHPKLSGKLNVEDPFDLEPIAVGARRHGTAIASAVVYGDLNNTWARPLERKVHFVNFLYATAQPELPERFPDLLPADMFESAVVGMLDGAEPQAANVIVINASLGDSNKPFAGRLSGWARVVDYLASKYGILFIISAGNHTDFLQNDVISSVEFEAYTPEQKARATLQSSASQIAKRRILAPAESMNAITVGALHADNYDYPNPLPALTFDVWANAGLCTVSSALGPGYGGAIKPDILIFGGRHLVRLLPHGNGHRLHPLTTNAAHFGGVAVAAPQSATSLSPDVVARTVGTSVAAALATGLAARAHEALEAAYPDFSALPRSQRAVLLKSLLVHSAEWTHARDLLVEVLGPLGAKFHYRQKDNVRRYLGYGALEPEKIINCATDCATLWAVGTITSNQGKRFQIPWPSAMSGKAIPHGISATLSWFTPPRPGSVSYRSVRMKIAEPEQLGAAGVSASGLQPDSKQAHKGTIVHRRWMGTKAAAIAHDGYFELDVQRELDDIEGTSDFAIVVTLEMQGEVEIYDQVLNRIALKPAVVIAV